ncbi:MAG: hypothetical protein ACTSU5_12735 [Promethearchaeota archaeon]
MFLSALIPFTDKVTIQGSVYLNDHERGKSVAKPARGGFSEDYPIQETHVTEFNSSGPVNPDHNQSIIYQYGYSEVGAFYSVWGNSTNEWDKYHTEGFNFSLPAEYYEYWNLSSVNYYNISSTLKPELDEKFIPLNESIETVDYNTDYNLAGGTHLQEITTDYSKVSGIWLRFTELNLNAGDVLRVYNESIDWDHPLYEVQGPTSNVDDVNPGYGGWTGWINGTSAQIVLNSSSTAVSHYRIQNLRVNGTSFWHDGTSEFQIDKDDVPRLDGENTISYKIHVEGLNLTHGAVFYINDPEGYNVTEVWTVPDTSGRGPGNNYTGPGMDLWSTKWVNPNYVNFNISCATVNQSLSNFTVTEIQYNVTEGWQRYDFPFDNPNNFITYTPFGRNVTVDFTKLLGIPASNAKIKNAYSSWTFTFNKTKWDTNLTIHDLSTGTPLADPIIVHSGRNYNFSFNLTDVLYGHPVDWFTFDEWSDNDVRLDIWQGTTLLFTGTSTLHAGIANVTVDFSVIENDQVIHAGDLQLLFQVNDTNHVALDNTSARATWRIAYFEQPGLTLNKVYSEVIPETTSKQVSTTAGTLFDPNTVHFNVSAFDIYGETGPMNGQPFNVTVMWEGIVDYTTTVYQSYNASDGANYTVFKYSFDKVGDWNVTFTLENSTGGGVPLGYYLPTTPLTVNLTVTPRRFLLDVYNGSGGLQPGQYSELYANITDSEEVDVQGTHYPLSGWRTEFYYLHLVGQQYETVFISTAYTNNSGISSTTFYPPTTLSGEEIFILVRAYTPSGKTLQFVTESAVMKKGFDVDKLVTSIGVVPSQDPYYYNETIRLDLSLEDELGSSLLGECVKLEITAGTTTRTYYLIIGENNTGFTAPELSPFLGTVDINASFVGSSSYYPVEYSTSASYDKAPTSVEVDVDPTGYRFADGDTLPVNVFINDVRNDSVFRDDGILKISICDRDEVEIFSETYVFASNSWSNHTFDWPVPSNGMFNISVSFYGATFHGACNYSTTVLVKRALVNVQLDPITTVAGQDLVIRGKITYASNGSSIAGVLASFEFTDLMGNVYVLGFNSSDSDGVVELVYPYDPTDIQYQYMVEFGGEITVTSRMDTRRESGFAHVDDFQIAKCPTQIEIGVQPYGGSQVLISINFNTFGYASPKGETLYVEIWSLSGYDYRTLELKIQKGDGTLAFFHELYADGDYYIRVVYKGSHTFQANAAIEIFNKEVGLLSNPQSQAAGTDQISVTAGSPGNPLVVVPIELLVLVLPLVAILFPLNLFSGVNKRKSLAVLLVLLFGIADFHGILVTNCSTPIGGGMLKDVKIGAGSNFNWMQDQNLPMDDILKIGEDMNLGAVLGELDKSSPEYSNLSNTLEGIEYGLKKAQEVLPEAPRFINKGLEELGFAPLASQDSPSPAISKLQNLDLGSFGMMPYPIGDVLNVSFSTTEDSSFFISITDVNLGTKVQNIFGTAPKGETQNLLIPIDEDHFKIGGKYALELSVYKFGVTEYLARDQRRMTFSVIRGFTKMDLHLNDIELDQDRYFTARLTEQYSNLPIANSKVIVLYMDPDTKKFVNYQSAFTNDDGEISMRYPFNSEQSTYSIRAIFTGDSAHFGCENISSYKVKPITTHLQLAASPAVFTDNGTMSAVLYDQYGHPLEDKSVEFMVHLEDTDAGVYDISPVTDSWMVLGYNDTDENGIARISYEVFFPSDKYWVCARFNGDERYNKSWDTSKILDIYKETLQVNFLETELVYGQTGMLSVKVMDDEGNPAPFNAVNFSAYVDHEWYELGATNTTGDGIARITYTPYFDKGTYPLRITKSENKRYECRVEYGTLTVDVTNSSLDVRANTTQYLGEVTLSATLTFQNGTSIEPMVGETLLFYLEQEMPDGSVQFPYIGFGVTDANGTAYCKWNATDRLPGRYTLKVFFPGNDIVAPAVAYEPGIEITKAQVKIAVFAPSTTPVMDYADFRFNLTAQNNDSVWGEKLIVTVYNRTDPTQVSVSQEITTDVEGNAFFRWCPPYPGNFTLEARLISDYYTAPVVTTFVTVARKAVMLNATMSAVRFFRGDVCAVTGNATIVYKKYDGSNTTLPATGVPLRFYIWNETKFVHPISGFRVPNMPLHDADYGTTTIYTEDSPHEGRFFFKFIMPDEFYGLQAGKYFMKIKVDTTKTGLYAGEAYISFDLVERTGLSVWVEPSENVTLAHSAGHPWSRSALNASMDYFVEEREKVFARLGEEDSLGLDPWIGTNSSAVRFINRNLTFDMGADGKLFFHVDLNNVPSIYNGTRVDPANNLTTLLQPNFDNDTGTCSFYYWPYNPGRQDVVVTYSGDRFFTPNSAKFDRHVYRRPTYFDTNVSYTKDLYRASTSLPLVQVQTWTRFQSTLTDVLNGSRVAGKTIKYFLHEQEMNSANGYSIGPSTTDANGQTDVVWNVDDCVQGGDHEFYFLCTQTRIWAAHKSDLRNRFEHDTPYTLEIWETTSIEIFGGAQTFFHGLTFIESATFHFKFKDQDGNYINDAPYNVDIAGMVLNQLAIGGEGHQAAAGKTAGTEGEFEWDLKKDIAGGTYRLLVDFLGDPGSRNLRPSSDISYILETYEYNHGFEDVLEYDSNYGDIWFHPFAVECGDDTYFNIQEARRVLGEEVTDGDVLVRVVDQTGWYDPRDVTYVWLENYDTLNYRPAYFSNLHAIIAFSTRENAEEFIQGFSKRTILPWDVVWPLANPSLVTHTMDYWKQGQDFYVFGPPSSPPRGGTPNGAAAGAYEFFNILADTARDNFARGLYVFIFRFLAVACTGFYEKTPDRIIRQWGYDYSTRTFLDFEDEPDPVIESPYGTSGVSASRTSTPVSVKNGNHGLTIAAGTHREPGQKITFDISQQGVGDLKRVLNLNFRLRYKPNKQNPEFDDHEHGINITLEDDFNHQITHTLSPSDISSVNASWDIYGGYSQARDTGDWVPVYIPLSEFSGHPEFRLKNVKKLIFTTVSDGFLDQEDEELYIDEMSFTNSSTQLVDVLVPGTWQKLDAGSWILKNFIASLFFKPIYNALIFGIGRAVFGPNGVKIFKDIFTWRIFFSSVESIILNKQGKKAPIDCLLDFLSILFTNLFNAARNKKYDNLSSNGSKRGSLAGIQDVLDNPKPAINWKTGKTWKRFGIFLITATLQSFFNNMPRYYLDLGETWTNVMEDGRTDVWKMAKAGFNKLKLKEEIIYFMWVFISGIFTYVAKKVNNRFLTAIIDNIVTLGYDLFFALLGLAVERRGSGNPSYDEADVLATAIANFLAFMLVDIVIDLLLVILNSFLNLPSWLNFLLDKIVRIIAKLIILCYFFPAEVGSILAKTALIMAVTMVVSYVIIPPIFSCVRVFDASDFLTVSDGWSIRKTRDYGEDPSGYENG